MGVIQNAVNQMLGTIAIAGRLSPDYEKRQELRKLGAQEKALTKQEGLLSKSIDPDEYAKGETVSAQQLKDIYAKKADVAQRQFELKPSSKSLAKAQLAGSAGGKGHLMITPAFEDDLEARAELAMSEVAQKQNVAQKQRRNFMNYLKEMPSSIGGKVGDLPIEIQKQIAKTYSAAERKNIMNTTDKGGKK